MKYLLIGLLFPLFLNNICFAQWFWQNPIPPGNDFFSVKFVNTLTGFVVGDESMILKTTNSGTTWEMKDVGNYSYLTDIEFIGENTGWTVDYYAGNIYKTTDAGETWSFSSNIGNYNLWDLFFINENTGWVCGIGPIYKTTDGGSNWTQKFLEPYLNITSIYFIDDQYGWAAADDNSNYITKILRTTDGGSTWSSYEQPNIPNLKCLFFNDQLDGFAVGTDGALSGSGGYIWKTTDGGISWNISLNGIRCNDIKFVNSLLGYAAGVDGTVIKTTNGGQSWTYPSTGIVQDLYSVSLIAQYYVWVAGTQGVLMSTYNAGQDWNLLSGDPNADIYSIDFTNKNNGIAVGEGGKILLTTNGGQNWQPKESGSVSWTLYSVSYGDSENAWVSSYNGEILHSSDGGETWNQQNSGISTPLHSIFFNNSDTGWTAGNNGIILKTTNSGNNWFQLNTGTTDWLRSIYFINKNTGWAAGSPSTLINTTDGGASWESLSPAGYYSFNAVYFLDEYKGWLVDGSSGSDGNILKTIDGGLNWQIQLNVPATSLMDVYFINADTGWVVGSRGQIWNSTNGGDEWILQDDDIYNGINSIAHSEDNDIWVGGSNEMILFLMRNIPVEINTFKAIIINNFVNLEWSTSTEMNNRGFKLLKKKYGINNYEPEWTEIAFIPGHGTTTEPQHYSFADNAVEPGKYQYKLKQIDYDGTFEYSQIVEVEIPLVDKFSLEQNYPNPFNPSTKIKYSIPEASFVTLKLFGVLGNEIATLVNEEQHAGIHEVEFNAIKNSWFPASGVYLYQLRAGDFISTKKMILLK